MPALSSCAEEGGEVSRGRNKMVMIDSHFKVIPFQLILLSLQVKLNGRQSCISPFIKHKSKICCPVIGKCERTAQYITQKLVPLNFGSWRVFSFASCHPTIATYVKTIPLAPGTIAMLVRTLQERSGWECKCEGDHRHK